MRQLGIFAKYWAAGAVKTRLAATIGDRAARELYFCFLQILVQRFAAVADDRAIAFTPEARHREFQNLAGPNWSVVPQASGHLGQRMDHFFSLARRRSAGPVVLIGSDSPTLPIAFVDQAYALLREVPVVLGPSTDGGYYLIGAAGPVPSVFEGVPWSTPEVYEQTVRLLRHAGCRYAALPEWYDVDDMDDLRRLQTELAQLTSPDSSLRELKERIDQLVPAH